MSASPLDRRVTPARPDLAAEFLRGEVQAARFVAGRARSVTEGAAPLRRAPAHDAPLETEALFGESVVVYEEEEGWAWGQLARDKYVGYLPAAALGKAFEPTHRLAVPRSFVYPGPSIKAAPLFALSLGARLRVTGARGDFAVLSDGGHVYARHLAAADADEPDFVAVAERFLEAPYLWGGRTSQGIDCSGLVQTALTAAGRAAPRDSDMMEAALGQAIDFDESLAGLRRGDLVFWKGHIGVMRDDATLLHASGWHMMVVAEALQSARERILERGGGAITSIRRL